MPWFKWKKCWGLIDDLLSLEALKSGSQGICVSILESIRTDQTRLCNRVLNLVSQLGEGSKDGEYFQTKPLFLFTWHSQAKLSILGGSALYSTIYLYLNEFYERYRLTTWNISVFSLFSVVQFKNTGCKRQSAMTSGQRYSQLTLITFELIKIPLWFPMTQVTDFHFSTVRNGTCYTSSECTSKGGTASGNCAAG